jgi:hypothetical protein
MSPESGFLSFLRAALSMLPRMKARLESVVKRRAKFAANKVQTRGKPRILLRIESPLLRGFRKNSLKICDLRKNGLITTKPDPEVGNATRFHK